MTAVALSLDGSVMSTTEVKLPEDGIGGLVSLKFWESEPDNKTFTLSTIVYDPHRLIIFTSPSANVSSNSICL